ncbi:MAG: hypothetical protein U1A27_08035 [Phycisphaerae bacterium]
MDGPFPRPVEVRSLTDSLATLSAAAADARHRLAPGQFGDDSPFAAADIWPVVHELRRRFAPGRRFLEWGSGLGTVTLAAAQIGYDACGIERDERLVAAARDLAQRLAIPARFAHGNCLPPAVRQALRAGGKQQTSAAADSGEYALSIDGPDGYAALACAPADFDVIYVFPHPDQAEFCRRVFAEHARPGAVLLVYSQVSGVLESVRGADGASLLRVC